MLMFLCRYRRSAHRPRARAHSDELHSECVLLQGLVPVERHVVQSPARTFLNSPRARARRVRFGPPDRLSPLGEVYLQPTLTTGHWTGEGGSRERGGEKMVWEPDRFNARVAHRLRGRPRFELIKARDLESLATA